MEIINNGTYTTTAMVPFRNATELSTASSSCTVPPRESPYHQRGRFPRAMACVVYLLLCGLVVPRLPVIVMNKHPRLIGGLFVLCMFVVNIRRLFEFIAKFVLTMTASFICDALAIRLSAEGDPHS